MTYTPLTCPGASPTETLSVRGVPFHTVREGGRVAALPYGVELPVGSAAGEQVDALFFLGMVTRARSGECGWAGERFYGYQRKLYLGDVLGRIHLLYDGNIMDAIPLIFGVNVWTYETFTLVQPHEQPAFPVFAPYREPLDSDPAAASLFHDSLLLHENETGEKYTRYVFALRPRSRKLAWVTVRPWGAREAGVGVSAITALTGAVDAGAWRMTGAEYYVQKRYLPSLDRLSRRLYQFRDDLPHRFPASKPDGYRGPQIELSGAPEAELLTNVYYHNIYDMAAHKIDADGTPHTSTRDAPCYGFYEGIGTYRQGGHYNYHDQIWSRDIGRMLCELIEHGEHEAARKAAGHLLRYLYDPSSVFTQPHWKRIVNASELGVFPENYEGKSFQEFVQGRENDGHASVMLMLYRLYQHGCVDGAWLHAHERELVDAAEWSCWQMDNAAESGFDRVLCSESESSNGEYGGYDLFSNAYSQAALAAFAALARALDEPELAARWQAYAGRLQDGIDAVFTADHPRYGRVLCEPESDNWPSELKRMASLLLMPETVGYDPAEDAPGRMSIWENTYRAQKETFFSPMVGGSMGYGQGYTTQAALLLDQVEDYTACLQWAARFSYHHTERPYIVPEGVTYHPSGRFWYRHTDLGNCVQQTEIIKCVRLVLGLDDLQPEAGLRLVPRLADGWDRIEARGYPIVVSEAGERATVRVDWQYRRVTGGYEAVLKAERPIRIARVRVGPFPRATLSVAVDGSIGLPCVDVRGTRAYAYVPVKADTRDLRLTVVAQSGD
jgi:hypothetical protein